MLFLIAWKIHDVIARMCDQVIIHSSCSQLRHSPCSSSTHCASSRPPQLTLYSCTESQTPCKFSQAVGWPRGSGPAPCLVRGDGLSGDWSHRTWCTRTNCQCRSHRWLSPEAQPYQCTHAYYHTRENSNYQHVNAYRILIDSYPSCCMLG